MNRKTVKQFLSEYNADRQSQVEDKTKVRWLRQVEMKIMSEVMHSHDNMDKPGITRGEVILREDNVAPMINGTTMDISEDPYMYVDGDTLVLTAYDPAEGEREADVMDMDTLLQVPEPYDDVYAYWLDARTAFMQGQFKQYDRFAVMYNQAYLEFQKYWNRTHRTNHVRAHFLRHEVL